MNSIRFSHVCIYKSQNVIEPAFLMHSQNTEIIYRKYNQRAYKIQNCCTHLKLNLQGEFLCLCHRCRRNGQFKAFDQSTQ